MATMTTTASTTTTMTTLLANATTAMLSNMTTGITGNTTTTTPAAAAANNMLIPGSKYGMPYYAPLAVLMISLSIFCILGNSLVLAAIIKFPSVRDNFAVAVATLSAVDIGFAFAITFSVLYGKHWSHPLGVCQFAFHTSVYFGQLSNVLLSYMSVERCIAVWAPFFYVNKISLNARIGVVATIVGVYLVADIPLVTYGYQGLWNTKRPCGPSSFNGTLYTALVTIQVIVCLAVTITANIIVFIGIRKQGKAMASKSDEQAKKAFERERQIAITAMTIVAAYLCTYLPYVVLGLYISRQDPRENKSFTELLVTLNYSYSLLLLNSSLNPIIYARKNKKYRDAMKSILSGNKGSGNQVTVTDSA